MRKRPSLPAPYVEKLRRRLFAKTVAGAGPVGECVVWNGTKGHHGYGRIRIRQGEARPSAEMFFVHVVAWFLYKGEWPPDDLELCHAPAERCVGRACIAEPHLRLGTHFENMQDRKLDGPHPLSLRTHCPKGHPYNEANTYFHPRKNGGINRCCRACARERNARRRKQKKL